MEKNSQTIYTREEFLSILRRAKERKRLWQDKAMKELTALHAEMEQAKSEHHFGIKGV